MVNINKHMDAEVELVQRLEEDISSGLARFADQVTRVEVHLSDQNVDSGGGTDFCRSRICPSCAAVRRS